MFYDHLRDFLWDMVALIVDKIFAKKNYIGPLHNSIRWFERDRKGKSGQGSKEVEKLEVKSWAEFLWRDEKLKVCWGYVRIWIVVIQESKRILFGMYAA